MTISKFLRRSTREWFLTFDLFIRSGYDLFLSYTFIIIIFNLNISMHFLIYFSLGNNEKSVLTSSNKERARRHL